MGESRRGLAGAGKADDQRHAILAFDGDDLATGMQGKPATVVDQLVPHPQAALLGLAKVVRVQDAGDVVLEVNRDQAVGWVALGLQARRIHNRQLWLEVLIAIQREVELLLHARDVGVGLFDDQAGRRAELWVVADVAIDHDHLLVFDVVVLDLRPLLALFAGDALVRVRLWRVGNDVG